MEWKGTKAFKEAFTLEGYHLKAMLIEATKYSWDVYKDGILLYNAKNEDNYAKSLRIAKAKAKQRMVKHLLSD